MACGVPRIFCDEDSGKEGREFCIWFLGESELVFGFRGGGGGGKGGEEGDGGLGAKIGSGIGGRVEGEGNEDGFGTEGTREGESESRIG